MQAHKDSKESFNKRPFNLQEAVILLDVYLSKVKNGTSITEAAETASVRLRSFAKSNGYVISDSYRSASGLVNRLRSLRGLYEGQESKSAPGTLVFAEVVSLYKNNRTRYEEILSTEKGVASQNGWKLGEPLAACGKMTTAMPSALKAVQEAVEIQPSWIKYDFTNAQRFEYTIPAYCAIAGVLLEGKNWARILVGITEQELDRHNTAMDLTLEPIDIDVLWKENERLMLGLEKTSMDFIRKTHDKYEKKGMAFAVAFSGGKDSLVLLDLVSRALSPDEFSVVFSNTGMELSTTIQSVEKAKKHWSSLKFYEAKSHLKPTDSWEEFGPPGRRMRWCCAVHKSVPTILLLREITGNYNIKAVVFDGVRAEESAARADRDEISVGAKNINQINCSPILKWGTSELFIYLLHNGILFNEAYRKGLFRVGCIVCPMSSAWWDSIVSDCYPDEMRELLSNVESYARATKPGSEVKRFIEQL